ncbi:MAG: hypothetical protein LT105_12650 [Lentimicrobium sp.]|jgi:hypothetical protein|nr:hypothetical protein [Lentimicrobium sp.]
MKTFPDIEPDDQFLMDLMQKMPVEKAPESFTSGVMQQVYSGFEPQTDTPEVRRQVLFGYFALLAAVVIIGLMIFAQLPFLKFNFLNDTDYLRNILNASMGILEGVKRFSTFLKESSTVIIILSSVGLLLIFERVLRRGLPQGRFFSF